MLILQPSTTNCHQFCLPLQQQNPLIMKTNIKTSIPKEKEIFNFEFTSVKTHPINMRFRLDKEELNTKYALSVEEATKNLKKTVYHVDYTSKDYEEKEMSSLCDKFEERRKKIEDEFGVDCSKLQYHSEVLSFMASNAKQPNYYEPMNCGCVRAYTGTCNTHSVVIYVRGSHNMDEILKNPPFCFMENLEIEERDNFDIKEAKGEWLDDNYNVVAYFEPYVPDIIGLDNKKGAIWQECGDRFQVRLQTKEELLRQHYKSMG